MKKIYFITITLFGALTATAQVNLANFDFNGSTGLPLSATTTTSNITAGINGTQSNAAFSGTATGTGAFVQNTTAGNALSMNNSSGTNTNYWTLTLGGSDLNKYMNYKVYFQSEHSSTGATGIAILYSTNGSTFTALSQTVSPGLNTTYTEAIVDLSSLTALNNQPAVYIRFAANGGTSTTGTLRIDNLQIQAALSPWTMSGGNVNFTGGVTATSFTTTGDAKINGNLTAGGLTSTSSNLNVTTPVVLSNTLKNTTLAGTGSRLLLTDATGLISPLAAGTSSQVLSGTGSWVALPASTFTASGSNAYFTGGNLGIGNNNPQNPLDVTGNARIAGNTQLNGNTSISGSLTTSSLSISSLTSSNGGFLVADANGNLSLARGSGNTSTNIQHCVTQAPWMIGGNTMGSIANSVLGTCDLNDFSLMANSNSVMWITTAGNVGIGNSSPIAVLDIVASGSKDGLNIGNSNNSSIFNVANNGRTFIGGNNNPTYSSTKMLTVNGDVCLANYNSSNPADAHANDGFSGLEILGNNGIPSRRGISVEADPNGDFNFYINGSQGYGSGITPAEFNFKNNLGGTITNLMTVNGNGQLILGASTGNANVPASNSVHSTALLQVKGDVVVGTGSTANIYVTQNGWADFVFDKNYNLMSLSELESYYKSNHHLPNVPTTKDIQTNGNNLGETDAVLLQKIEENTLYIVELKKQLEAQQKLIEALTKQLVDKK